MCCDGSIFHQVRLQSGDSPSALAALGLKLKRKRKELLLLQPCRAHSDGACSIYHDRPQRCRLFECRQLRGVADGTLTEAAAAAAVRAALDQLANIYRLFRACGERNSSGPLTVRYDKIAAEPLPPNASDECRSFRKELEDSMARFDSFVDLHFRPAN